MLTYRYDNPAKVLKAMLKEPYPRVAFE